MFRNNLKSPWNRSNVYGRKVVYVPQSRIADLCPATSVASCPDAAKDQNNVEDATSTASVGKTMNEPNLPGVNGKEDILSIAGSNIAVHNSDNDELSVNEKRAAKRKKQKESCYNVQKLTGDSWTLEGALKYCGLELKLTKDSTEVMEDKRQAYKHQNRQTVERRDVVENDSGFGDWSRHELLGLASVKNGLITPSSELSEGSETGKNLSECSEVISPSELDTDDILRSLVTDKTAGNGFGNVGIGNLSNTLDQRSSVTDSSGVETSSDADSDHPYVVDSVDQKSDVPNGQLPDFHQPDDSACEQEAEFVTVSKKRKPKSLQVDRNQESTTSFSSTDFVSPDSGESSPRQEKNASTTSHLPNSTCADHPAVHKECIKLPENSLSLGSAAHTMPDSEPCSASESGPSFDVRHQSSVNFSVRPKSSSAEKPIADLDSMCLDNSSSRASLSDISLDDFELSYLLKETLEDDWTVVRNGRRSKNNVQSTVDPLAAGESKQNVSIDVGKCSTSVIREHGASEHGRVRAGTNSGRGRWSTQNSRCKSFDGSNSKTFDRCWYDNGMKSRQEASQKNFFSSNFARSNVSTEAKYRDTNCDIMSRCNSNKEYSLLESNSVPSRCQEIPRFSRKSTVPKSDVPMKNNSTVVTNSSDVAKTAVVTMADEPAIDRARNTEDLSSEKPCLSIEINKSRESSNSKLPIAEKTFFRHGAFDLIEAQIYLYREYQEVLKERGKIPHLVVIYDPDSES